MRTHRVIRLSNIFNKYFNSKICSIIMQAKISQKFQFKNCSIIGDKEKYNFLYKKTFNKH